MRLVTWNLNSLRQRLPRVLSLLAEHAPDVVMLQETKSSGEAFPHAELAAAGYRAVDHSAGRWAGVAILARDPLTDVVRGLDGEPDPAQARWIEASTGGLRVASVYVPNGRAVGHPEYERKLAFLDAARARIGTLDVLAGDFNVCPSDLDVYDPAGFAGSTHVQPAERARFAALLADGHVDAFRSLTPDAVQYTWWDYRAGHFHKGLGLRIDAFLVAARLTPLSCGIDRDYRKGTKPSDHAPLLLELARADPPQGAGRVR